MSTTPAPALGTLVTAISLNGRKDPARRAAVEQSHDGAVAIGVPGRRSDDSLVFGFRRYMKTVPTYAAKMDVPFRVDTLEGLHEGKAGDYLAIGAHGEMYPIDAEVMEASYEERAEDEPAVDRDA